MISDRDVAVAALLCRCSHLFNGAGTIAPDRVHLEITHQKFRPRWLPIEQGQGICHGKKVTPPWMAPGPRSRWLLDPVGELARDERPNAVQVEQRPTAV